MGILIVVLILLVMAGIVGGAIFFTLKKFDPKNADKTEDPNITTTQEFLPFKDIRDNTIILADHKYRAVIECSATNYNLKTSAERAIIEASFQQFLNGIGFPITFFLQTRVIDNSKRMALLKKELEGTLEEFPGMEEYARQYERDMADLNDKIGNSQQKKRYIIVPYDDVVLLDNLSEEEMAGYAAREIRNRCNMIISSLESVGVVAHILETPDLIELVYSCYNRDDYSYSEAISDKDAFSLFVNGEHDNFKDMPKEALLDVIFNETINRMELGNVSACNEGLMALEELKELRKKYGGYYNRTMN